MIAISGAGGFIGGALCEALRAEGLPLLALCGARVPAGVSEAACHQVDLTQATHERLRNLLAGCDSVVSLAGAHQLARNDPARLRAVNVEGALALARAAHAAGVRRFVHVSSVKALGEGGAAPYRDDDDARPEDAYGRSKREAELALQAFAESSGLALVILRPPVVYGPGGTGNIMRLLHCVDHGWPLPLGGIGNQRSLIYVGNLVDAIRTALLAGGPTGCFLVSDGVPVSTTELVEQMASALGRQARLFSLPQVLVAGLARALRREGAYRRMWGSLSLADDGFRARFGWTPPFGFEEAMQRTVASAVRSAQGKG